MNARIYRVAVVAALVVTACGGPPAVSGPPGSPASSAPTDSSIGPSAASDVSPAVVASIALDADFYGVAAGPEGVWLLSPSGRVITVDRTTNTISAEVAIPVSEFGNIAVGNGSVWVTDFDHDSLSRIDPTKHKIVATIPMGENPEGIEVTTGAVFVSNHRGGSITRVDPATNKVVATFKFAHTGPSGPKDIVVAGGDIWTTVPSEQSLYRLEPSAGDVVAKVIIPGELSSPISDGASVYLVKGVTVVRVDPAFNGIDRGFTGGNMPLAYGQSAFWSLINRDLVRLDPKTLTPAARWTVLAPVDAGKSATGVAVDDDSVWLSIEGRTLLRVSPTN